MLLVQALEICSKPYSAFAHKSAHADGKHILKKSSSVKETQRFRTALKILADRPSGLTLATVAWSERELEPPHNVKRC